MSDFSYVLTEDFVAIFCLNNPLLNFEFFEEDFSECFRDANMCIVNLFVTPSQGTICKILLFFKEFCQIEEKSLTIFCANKRIQRCLKKHKIDQFIEVGLMK